MPELRDERADVVEAELDAELLEPEQPVEWKELFRTQEPCYAWVAGSAATATACCGGMAGMR
jgi:hypothetical protein